MVGIQMKQKIVKEFNEDVEFGLKLGTTYAGFLVLFYFLPGVFILGLIENFVYKTIFAICFILFVLATYSRLWNFMLKILGIEVVEAKKDERAC
jgi:hypothetical protein